MSMDAIPTKIPLLPQTERAEAAEAAGDRDGTFAALYEAQFGRIYGFLRYRVGDAALAEDMAAEVFARSWAALGRLRAPESAVAWLFRTARNLVADHYRGRRAALPIEALPPEQHPLTEAPEGGVLAAERLADIIRCLEDLNDREREVVGLRCVAGLRHREIAAIVGTTEGNVAKITHRAMGKLRRRLGEKAGDGENA